MGKFGPGIQAVLLLATAILLDGCGVLNWTENQVTPDPQLSYSIYDSSSLSGLPNNSIGYSLEASAISFASSQPSGPGKSALSPECSDANWTGCLSGVTPTSAVILPDSKNFPASAYQTAFVVRVDNTAENTFTTSYGITATPLTNSQILLQQISITSQNNLDNIVKGAGAGAAAGIVFGPVGTIVGAAVGGGLGLGLGQNADYLFLPPGLHPQAAAPVPPPPPTFDITPLVCPIDTRPPSQTYNYSKLQNLKSTDVGLYLPFVITPGLSSNFFEANTTERTGNFCWHPIPNNLRPNVVGGSEASQSLPGLGDGWFYRIVDDGNDFTDPETGVVAVPKPNTTTAKSINVSVPDGTTFPYSACRKITVQITWWHALSDYIGQLSPSIEAIDYDVEIADPGELNYLTVPKSGSINFRLMCGAYATNTFATSSIMTTASDISTQISAVKKAQPSSSSKSSSK